MLRIVITRGGRRILLIERLPEWPARVRVALVALSPNEILAGVKSISYAANMHATRIANRRGADEAVYVDAAGQVLEAPTSSVFWVGDDGRLRTPVAGDRHPRLDHPPGGRSTRCPASRAPSRPPSWSPRRRRSWPRPPARSSRSQLSRRQRLKLPGGGPAAAAAAAALAEAVRAERGRESGSGMDLELSDEQRLISQGAREFADELHRAAGARQRPGDALRRRDGPPDRRARLPRRAGRRGVRGPRPRSRQLRADRRADRPRLQRRPDGRLRADLAGRGIDRTLGHRGAEAALAAAALQRGVVRLLRPDRARHAAPTRRACGPAPSGSTAAGRSAGRRCGSRSATSPTSP